MEDMVSQEPTIISIVVPLYNEEKNVSLFVQRLESVLKRLGLGWELVFALDPSPDRTREMILDLMAEGYPIRLITFSRRIGKPLSVLAGLDYSRGDACIVMDVDLQDPPELIEEMVEKWRQGFKVVIAQRRSRKGEALLYLKAAELFYWILDQISEVKVPRNTGDYRLLDARVVREICLFRERHGFLRGLTAAAGFPTTTVLFDRDPRHAGKTQIPIMGAVNIALDGIVPFSRVPVRAIFVLGIVLCFLGVGGGIFWLLWGLLRGLSGQWPFFLLCFLNLGLTGIILASLGVIGEYLVRVYEETRQRPLYILDELREADSLDRKLGAEKPGA